MNFSSSLSNPDLALVIDTSVLINIHHSTYGVPILSAIPNNIIVPTRVRVEFDQGGLSDRQFLLNLEKRGLIAVHEMTDEELDLFGQLASKLDDGESATIAIAIRRGMLPVIDEKKGRTEAMAHSNSVEPGWSLDLLRHPAVLSSLGEEFAKDALFLALRDNHMRIPEEQAETVISLIGEDRARLCTCLPNYKKRFGLGPIVS